MLLNNHVQYSLICLDALKISGRAREQISLGVTANDLCELSGGSQIFIKQPNAIRAMEIFIHNDDPALFQSHHGRLASLHAMSKGCGEPASSTRDELAAWFGYLNELATGKVPIGRASKIELNHKKMRALFADGSIAFEDINDTREISKIRYRSIGMMLHLIQDSYTASHCERNDDNELVKFYCYEAQDSAKHKACDDVSKKHKAALMGECSLCVESLLDNAEYDCAPLLALSADAAHSDGGCFV
ncbi:MAG: hypothetical protein PHQ60_14430 [Sideroxydans sp.]|nr:hypothetical protein [Sideroxydans sp.]